MGQMILATALLFCVSVFGNYVLGLPIKLDDPISTNLKMIADADGKYFFVDLSVHKNWTEAGAYCESLGLKLASVTSTNQENALKPAFGPDFDAFGYWTSGRDAQLPRQFTWNETGDAVSDGNLELRSHGDVQYQTCIFFWSRADNHAGLYYTTCDVVTRALCST